MTSTIYPGEGLNRTLVLGASLYDTLSRCKLSHQKLQVSYLARLYLRTPVLVAMPSLGVRLMFASAGTQPLLLVEVVLFDHLKLTYNGHYLNDIVYVSDEESAPRRHVLPPNLKVIYNKIFGPTFPGTWHPQTRTYVLSYPGVAFKFRVELRDLLAKVAQIADSNGVLSKLTNWDTASDIPCVAVAIFQGQDYALFHRGLRHTLTQSDESCEQPRATTDKGNTVDVRVDLAAGTAQVTFADKRTAVLQIGRSTQMDVLRVLGPPDAYFNKFDSRLLIHKHLRQVHTLDSAVCKFHNYFRYGLDFLYNLSSPHGGGGGVLEKIVLHNGGLTELLDFMQWNKCNWTVESGTALVHLEMYFRDFGRAFLDAVAPASGGPVLLNRNESEITNDDDLEIVQVGDASLCDLVDLRPSNAYKTWGQLKLYGCKRCIWEVLDSNGCVSSVTIY